jgi:Protein of unknown function (DUF3089)
VRNLLFLLIITSAFACKRQPVALKSHFSSENIPPVPDYSKPECWAALPTKLDSADAIPKKSNLKDEQSNAQVDVFFIHPTIFTKEPQNKYDWNADVNDNQMNQNVDNSTILNQSTAFNGSCRVYAPRYRQAHYYSFVTDNQEDKLKALGLAYLDVKAAFEYYLKNHNQNRPIVIASHSQGTVHAVRLLKEFFDGKPLQNQLVEAYLVGIGVQPNAFLNIKPSTNPEDFGGFVCWNTYSQGYFPTWYDKGLNTALSTNPLTWKLDEVFAPNSLNKGGVGPKFTMYPNIVDAQNHKGMLWINKPYVKGRFLLKAKSWHIADINFFYMNIRENVALRIESFMKEKK